MAANTSIITSSVITSTSQHKRDFSEKIRRLYPEATKMLALVKGSNLDAFGKVSYDGKGMIQKRPAKRMYIEWATYTPIDVMYEAQASSTGTTLKVSDSSYFQTGDKIVNTSNYTVGIVSAIPDSTTVSITSVTGNTFSVEPGDWVSVLSSSYEEGTSRYNTVTNELTTRSTYLEIFREGVSIADTVKNTPQYTEEGMMERYMTDKMVQALRKVEGSFIFSKKSTSGTTNVSIGGTTYPLTSMDGLLSYAGTAFPMGGTFNWETFNTVLYPIMPQTLRSDETLYMMCGRKVAAVMNQWANNSYLTMGSNQGTKFGKKTKTFIMGGALDVELLVHERFDVGGLANSALFFQNSDLVYRFMEGMDINIRENAQLPATMGTTNIIEGVVGLQCMSGGANVKLVTELLAA